MMLIIILILLSANENNYTVSTVYGNSPTKENRWR